METPVQCAARLLAALNELVDREGVHLRAGSFDLALEVRKRTDPLVRRLVELAGEPGVDDFRTEVKWPRWWSATRPTFGVAAGQNGRIQR